jgi:hypothetical protein
MAQEVKREISVVWSLYDDESTRKKFTVMNKAEILEDDARNADSLLDFEDFFEFGHKYKITYIAEDLGPIENEIPS